MHDSYGAESLAEFEAQNSPEGLFLRYARGRMRHFLNRLILGLLGAVFVGIVVSLPLGLFAGALIVCGEVIDCLALARLVPRVAKLGLQPHLKWAAVISGAIQSGFQLVALLTCQAAAPSPEMNFFLTSVITGVMINAGLVRPYFQAATDVRLFLSGMALLVLLVSEMRDPNSSPDQMFLFMATVVMLSLTVTMLVRQSDRAFFKHESLKRSMAESNAHLRRSQIDLARSGLDNQRLALAARHANDAIVFLDTDNCYSWVNEAFTKMTGYTPEQALGRHPGELLNADETSEETLQKLVDARQKNEAIRVEIFNRGQNGRGYWVDTSIIPIFDDSGKTIVTLAVEREITEAKQREADLAKAREAADAAALAKSRFLANMSHEIRTPMNGVLGVTELLAETRLTKTQRDYVETVLESARALLRIINDILDLSKLQSGAAAPEQRPFDLLATVESTLRLLRPSAGAKGVSLTLQLDPVLAPGWQNVLGDDGKLRQILINLVGNALKFTLQGEVVLRIGPSSQGLGIQVIDSGIGIEPDRLNSIFDSFTQADDTISRRFGGTGLGLTISSMLARQMGGEIKVSSTLGKGSCFTLDLPLPAAQLPALPTGPSEQRDAPITAFRVLVAEDNRTNMLIMRRILAGQVAEMIEADDGQNAIELWQSHAPDLILMDISMPVMDGLTAMREIRAAEQKLGRPRCTILALTASSHWENQESCRETGFDGYLIKPYRREALLRAIADHCGSVGAPPLARSA